MSEEDKSVAGHGDTAESATLERVDIAALSEVAACLATLSGSDQILEGVTSVLKRRLGLAGCRAWVRTPDGAGFHAIGPLGDRVPSDLLPASALRADSLGALDAGEEGWIHAPFDYEGERLGLLEAKSAEGTGEVAIHTLLSVVASFIAPLLGAIELYEDLASEIALRTREIEDQRKFIGKIIDSLPHGLYVIDRDYRIQAWNLKRETGTQGVSRKEAIGRTVFDVLHRQSRQLLQREFDRVFETGQVQQMEIPSRSSDEVKHYRISKIPMRLSDAEVTHVITIGEDISDWKKMYQRVAESEKLAAVGQLAAGVMHEINNPLATIGACIEAISGRRLELPSQSHKWFDEYITIINSELERCQSIIDGLLDFSRPKAKVKSPVQINQIVEDAAFLARHHQKFAKIDLDLRVKEGLPIIRANAEQLIQALLALLINAIDAIETSGLITVTTGLNAERSDEVVVTIRDTGPGIQLEDVTKIFEPFYTTKEPGHGTGLGLSICYGIIQQHHGRILVESPADGGALFKVILPVNPPAE